MKKIHLFIASLVVVLAAVLAVGGLTKTAFAAGIDTTRDCDESAIIKCGVMTVSELQTKYKENTAGDLPAVYKAFGVDELDGFVDGVVWRDGRVTVGNETVATGAMTAARNMTGGTIAGSEAKVISPSVWPAEFITAKPAHVKMVNGKFAYAVLKTCGNPVKATPVVVKTPEAACTALTVQKISRTEYTFTATSSTKDGATISGYVFSVKGPNMLQTQTVNTTAASATTSTVEVKKAGTYTVSVTVKTSVGNKTDTTNCQKEFTVEEEVVVTPTKTTVCNPANGQTISVEESEASKYKPVGDVACQPKVESAAVAKIASTGPTDILGGVAGLGSLTAAGYYLRASRSRLLSIIKK